MWIDPRVEEEEEKEVTFCFLDSWTAGVKAGSRHIVALNKVAFLYSIYVKASIKMDSIFFNNGTLHYV